MMYRHCKLRQGKDWPCSYYNAWLPVEFAKEGKIVDLLMCDQDGDHWSRGWEVVEVFNVESEDYVRDHERDYLSQRKASDI